MRLQLKNNQKNTIVPNEFIENCVKAPKQHTAAFLLGLMYSQKNEEIELGSFCARLGMSEGEVITVFEYWQRKGFARIINSDRLCFEFGVFAQAKKDDSDIYTESEYNRQLQKIFGSRQLSPHEYLKIYDYTDTFHLPKKVVLRLAEYCVLLKGARVSIPYMDKVAKSWAEEENIDSPEKADELIARYKMVSSGVPRVLKQLGISKRNPTKDEIVLFEKWTKDWGFTLEAILTACSHTTAAREPSMKYLDRILERLNADGDTTSRKISQKKEQSENITKNLKELMRIIGLASLKPSFEHESLYQKWTSVYAFDIDLLITAAKSASSKGKKSFSGLDDILTEWYNNKIYTPAEAKAYISQKQSLDTNIAEVFAAAGISKRVSDAHRKIYNKWSVEFGLSHDVIISAAEASSLSDNPYRYLNSILSNWHDEGVKTLADARKQADKFSGGKNTKTKSSKTMYYERPTENYDHLAVDLFKDEGA